jgi:SAM-dependent methyltransferase
MLWKHDKPIITSDNCAGWPDHVSKLPIREMWRWVSSTINPMHGDWYHNSLAYILLYAAFIGVRDLRVFGADYATHSSGTVEDGHPNVAYWVGKLEATGLVVTMPADSSFLNANQRGHIYGYQRDPRTIPANRARFRAMVGLEPDEDSTALLSAERQVGVDISEIQADHVARYQWAASKMGSDRVLDLGSGCGYGSAILADAGARFVFGFDLSAESVAYANEHYCRPNVIWKAVDLDGKPPPLMEADSATAFEIIEHLADPRPLLSRLQVKRLFASVPNERVVPYRPGTAPFHQRHYTQDQFKDLLRDCGWLVAEWRGQDGPNSPVGPLEKTSRTLIVEAVRKQ